MSLGFQGSPLLALILSLGIRFSRYGCRFFFLNLPMGLSGLEPPTSRLSGVRSNRLSYKPRLKFYSVLFLLLLSVSLFFFMIRQPPAFPYRPQYSIIGRLRLNMSTQAQTTCSGWVRVFPLSASPPDLFQCLSSFSASRAFFLPLRLGFPSAPKQQCSPYFFLRKEVIQPHLPIRLPCYDFTPVTRPAFGGSSLFRLGHRLRAFPAPMV